MWQAELLQINIFRNDVIYHTIALNHRRRVSGHLVHILRNMNHNLIRKNKVINVFFNKQMYKLVCTRGCFWSLYVLIAGEVLSARHARGHITARFRGQETSVTSWHISVNHNWPQHEMFSGFSCTTDASVMIGSHYVCDFPVQRYTSAPNWRTRMNDCEILNTDDSALSWIGSGARPAAL